MHDMVSNIEVNVFGVPVLFQRGHNPNLHWNSPRPSPSPKENATLGWDNPIPTGSPKGTSQRRVPTAIFGLYKELPLICNIIFLDPFSHTSHSHLGSKEHVIILLSLPVGGFGSCLDLSQL